MYELKKERELLHALTHVLEYMVADFDQCDIFYHMSEDDYNELRKNMIQARLYLEDKFICRDL
tara:strand:+ start:1364 stop:1552 length:189 start_codon:yes stop_codon:yes gene_type:complete